MSMKPQGDGAKVIQFPAHKIRKPAAVMARTPVSKSAATTDPAVKARALLAAAETCWYHGEAVSEAQKR